MEQKSHHSFAWIWVATAGIGAALIAYSVTFAFVWDEGFHLIAAQLINAGKRPYFDFLFAQTPLNVYWNALILRVLGEHWKPVHVVAALESTAAAFLVADYVFRRFPAYKTGSAIAAAMFTGLNVAVFEFCTVGQAYGACLLLVVIAFRFAVASVDRGWLAAAGSGIAIGAAAASSLLTAPMAPVLLLWITVRGAAERWVKVLGFCAGVVVGFGPMLYFFFRDPRRIIFDVIKYHVSYRQVDWGGWLSHDIEVVSSWLDCSQAFLLGALALAGFIFAWKSDWDRNLRWELYLCGWLMVAEIGYLMTGHPTFARYFLVVVPFASVLAAAGLMGIANVAEARWPFVATCVLIVLGLGRTLYVDRSDLKWETLEKTADKVEEVTKPGASLYADEHVYFLTQRIPPPGMEWNGSHKIDLPLDQALELRFLPRAELDRRVKAGAFATLETCDEDEPDRLGLSKIYAQKAVVGDCQVFWDRISDSSGTH